MSCNKIKRINSDLIWKSLKIILTAYGHKPDYATKYGLFGIRYSFRCTVNLHVQSLEIKSISIVNIVRSIDSINVVNRVAKNSYTPKVSVVLNSKKMSCEIKWIKLTLLVALAQPAGLEWWGWVDAHGLSLGWLCQPWKINSNWGIGIVFFWTTLANISHSLTCYHVVKSVLLPFHGQILCRIPFHIGADPSIQIHRLPFSTNAILYT